MNGWIIIAIILVVSCICIVLMQRYEKNNKNKRKYMNNEDVKNLSYGLGMSYNIQDEPKIMSTLKDKKIEEIAYYADKVCKHNAQNVDFLKTQFTDVDKMYKQTEEELKKEPSDKLLNPTSIGNAAYIAVYSPEPYNSYGKKIFDILMSYVK